LLILSIFMLVYVLINPYVIPGKEDFKRWFSVPFIGTVQPSEIAKVALIIYLAWSLSKRRLQVEKDNDRIPTVVHAFIICLVCGLVYLENHLSAVIIIFAIGIVMMFFGGTNARVFALGAAFLVIAVFVALKTGVLKDYAGQRIDVWQKLLHNEQLTAQEEQGEGWQILQSLYAIGSGGMFGMGFGNSKQKHLYLPEPQNDFIFAIVCEELGYIRAIIIMLLFLLLVLRGFYIALHHKNRFAQLLVLGICFQLGLEAGLNIAVVTGTVPNTGIALPFFSSGGSALLTLLVEMGMVLSVSRTMDKKPKKVKEEVEAVNGNS
ncbi:MAG: FtsW/RodA/SpoVE family cell cycle protein, partial [Clostridia bacterium]|nr:FtsW/RodA/SpoVE family cell cycle protein [Clostridia bacterium]